jgi:hypothetical protein
MNVICHQYIGMYIDMVSSTGILQTVKIEVVVVFGKETGVSIIAALYHMTGYTRNIDAGFSGHGDSFR